MSIFFNRLFKFIWRKLSIPMQFTRTSQTGDRFNGSCLICCADGFYGEYCDRCNVGWRMWWTMYLPWTLVATRDLDICCISRTNQVWLNFAESEFSDCFMLPMETTINAHLWKRNIMLNNLFFWLITILDYFTIPLSAAMAKTDPAVLILDWCTDKDRCGSILVPLGNSFVYFLLQIRIIPKR